MNKSTKIALAALAVALGFSSVSRADDRAWAWSPLGLGLAAPIQLPFMESDVYGLRFGGFLGYNNDVYGIDAGIAELCADSFAGLQASVVSWTEGDAYGLQFGAFANVAGSSAYGLQAGAINVAWDDSYGVQIGLINCDVSFSGVQLAGIINWNNTPSCGLQASLINGNQDEFSGASVGGLVNYGERYTGFQIGFVNATYDMTGFQLGVFNACDHMHGVQFGLINLICESKLPIMVLANASF